MRKACCPSRRRREEAQKSLDDARELVKTYEVGATLDSRHRGRGSALACRHPPSCGVLIFLLLGLRAAPWSAAGPATAIPSGPCSHHMLRDGGAP